MKKLLSAVLALLISVSLAACGGEKGSTNEIPDVFGINYTDAIEILEADGFQVSAVEVSVGSFSDKLLYPLKKVDKGTVFKIDNYIIDSLGKLNKNFDVFYHGGLVTADKSVTIFYAKEDYLREEIVPTDAPTLPSDQETSPEPTVADETTPEPTIAEETTPEPTADETEKPDDNTIGKEFKAAMDGYEKFIDEYVTILKKYQKDPTDLSILTDYAKYMGEYADMMQKFEKWENEDLNTAETAYYIEVQARISKKLLEIA